MDAKIISGQLASDCYTATPQQMLNEWASKSSSQWPNVVGIVKSTTFPVVTDRDKLWVRVDGNGNVTGQFAYGNGQWHWPHEIPVSSSFRTLWVGAEVDLVTYDGGSVADGAFWEADHTFDGRSPMGAGLIPTSSPSKTLSIGEDFGEGAHQMTSQEVGPHTHPMNTEPSMVDGDNVAVVGTGGGQFGLLGYNAGQYNGSRVTPLSVKTNSYASAGQQNMPLVHPVRGLLIIKRTSRVYRLP